ncbi:hypothetical protein RJ639_039158 [Escallonia herrerae]|uniref:WRKY domain-containing protein n=1 Tax=Escallonia herrerae TaxID=1293975 RepID=A0AA88WT59_9ASTE|nr:hypothetical protein RJ639_039158 [Escallonia herrerae]
MEYSCTHNPNPNLNSGSTTGFLDMSEFELLDDLALELDGWEAEFRQHFTVSSDWVADSSNGFSGLLSLLLVYVCRRNQNAGVKRKDGVEGGLKVAFRTKSDLEIMDDGFKWRKYGKKMVKNSPNPRYPVGYFRERVDRKSYNTSATPGSNYYKCSSVGCKVKKRVERDVEDSSYVITTYDGKHNHESPSAVYYDWTSSAHSSG